MLFKDISYLEIWRPLCSAEWNHLCSFGRSHYEERFCEIILFRTSGPGADVIERYFLFRALLAHFFGGAKPFLQF